ncbi:predicted protein [Sparassis crispa]|uniref:Terpenoid synthase n=1 Tax=Sparassis crispa TaxID=139825 RepID=A0A401GJ90_9APHY|nr:predicted protein [Sparassis crispa]GBE82195.1 predicted protein [Sparassis crispa]
MSVQGNEHLPSSTSCHLGPNAVHGTSSNEASLLAVSQQVIRDFLDRMNVTIPPYLPDLEVMSRVYKVLQTWDFGDAIRPHVITALTITITAYNHLTDIEAKVQIALFTAITTALDVPVIMNSVSWRDLHTLFLPCSAENRSGLVRELRGILVKMWDHYPPCSASAIFSSVLKFISATIFENETKAIALSSDGAPFIEYRRAKGGLPEAYAYFIWEKAKFPDIKVYVQAIPHAMRYINYVNDILSFYKEELEGETGNYIGDRGLVEGKSALEVLREVIDETVGAAERVRRILGEGEARDAWENFVRGYTSFHISSPRYRLQEVVGSRYLID